MAYEGSRKSELWGTVFDALHDEPTAANMGRSLESGLSSRMKKRFNRHESYLRKLPPTPIYPRYYIYRHIHQITINYCQSLHQKIIDMRSNQQSVYLSMNIGGAKWTSDAETDSWGRIWGRRIPPNPLTDEADSPTFLRLSSQAHIGHFFQLARCVNWVSESEKASHVNPQQLVLNSQASHRWMMAVYETSKAMEKTRAYMTKDPLSSSEWILNGFHKAYNLLIGLEDGVPFGWKYGEERKMATYILGEIAWLFGDLKEWSNAEAFQRLYIESWRLYPDDEFAWIEENASKEHEAWRKDFKTKYLMPDRGKWDKDRKNRRETWERKHHKTQTGRNNARPSENANGYVPSNSPNDVETAEQKMEARKRQLNSLFNEPLSTWTIRQDAVDSRADLFIFLEWLLDKHKPPDPRQYALFTELLRLQKEAAEETLEYKKLCRQVVQIYHPDRNVLEDVIWRENALEITKVYSP